MYTKLKSHKGAVLKITKEIGQVQEAINVEREIENRSGSPNWRHWGRESASLKIGIWIVEKLD